MQPMPVGTPIRIRRVDPGDSYRVGGEYVIHVVDPSDGTLRARDPKSGVVGNWLRWDQVELGGNVIGWSFLKTVLSRDTVRLLEAFDGLEALMLREDVADTLLQAIADLPGRIRDLAGALDPGLPPMRQKEIPDFLVGLDGFDDTLASRPSEALVELDEDDLDEALRELRESIDKEDDDADLTA